MSEWKPIDSAPMDGTHVQLFGTLQPMEGLSISGAHVISGYWDTVDGSWCGSGATWVGPFYDCTHWQPLPPPPTTEKMT